MKGTYLKIQMVRLPRARKGQSLVEAIVAIGIAIAIITGLVVLAVGAVRTATLSRNRTLAVQYAQEATEALRSIRDRDFNDLPLTSGNKRLVWTGSEWDTSAGTETITSGGASFQRRFTVTTAAPASSTKPQFTITVTWTDSAGSHAFDLVTYLADWR